VTKWPNGILTPEISVARTLTEAISKAGPGFCAKVKVEDKTNAIGTRISLYTAPGENGYENNLELRSVHRQSRASPGISVDYA
jgi:hypothetical protein